MALLLYVCSSTGSSEALSIQPVVLEVREGHLGCTAKQNFSSAVQRTQRHQAQKAGTIWKYLLVILVNSFIGFMLIFLEARFDFDRSRMI